MLLFVQAVKAHTGTYQEGGAGHRRRLKMATYRKKRGRSRSISSEEALTTFCKQVARKYGLNPDRIVELRSILREAMYSSATGGLSTQKAISLTLRFIGSAIDVFEFHI